MVDLFPAAMLILGIIIGFWGPVWASNLVTYFENKKVIDEITPLSLDETKLCKGPHAWIPTKSLTDRGYENIQVCQVCGFLPSMGKMAKPEAIDRIEENNKIRAIQEMIYRDFVIREDDDMKKYFDEEIKNGVDFEKLAHIHTAGMTFNARLNAYKASRMSEVEKVLSKGNA